MKFGVAKKPLKLLAFSGPLNDGQSERIETYHHQTINIIIGLQTIHCIYIYIVHTHIDYIHVCIAIYIYIGLFGRYGSVVNSMPFGLMVPGSNPITLSAT